MVDNLIDFYENNLSMKKLIFSYSKTYFKFCFMIFPITGIITSILFFLYKKFFILIIMAIVLMIPLYFINSQIKKILSNRYKINSKSFLWDINGYNKIRMNLLL
jgi:hypothetical protein